MQYFDTLPKIIAEDTNGVRSVVTNLMARCSVIPNILKNPMVFYQYDIQDDDSPEIVAHKYYDDSYRYWIVLFANQILDPQWGWPLSSRQFEAYIKDKYPEVDPHSVIDHYTKTITQYDFGTNTTTVNTVDIGENEYNTTATGTKTYDLPTGKVSVTIETAAVSVYDNELNINESKRTINILNKRYVGQLEKELKELLS
jgi:hypothetical protein